MLNPQVGALLRLIAQKRPGAKLDASLITNARALLQGEKDGFGEWPPEVAAAVPNILTLLIGKYLNGAIDLPVGLIDVYPADKYLTLESVGGTHLRLKCVNKRVIEKERRKEPLYLTAEGTQTTKDDLNRLVWIGMCGNWTDDWTYFGESKVPICPDCGAPGYQATAQAFFHEREDQTIEKFPLMIPFLESVKETCMRGKDFEREYAKYAAQSN